MNATLLESAPQCADATFATSSIGQVRESVRQVLLGRNKKAVVNERRREKRHAFPYPIYLTPVSNDGEVLTEETFAVLGKHISECGLDFYHTQPLAYRRGIASLELADDHWVGLLMDLSWCRFNRHGWYENGGRFLSTAVSPLEGKAA